MVSIKLTVFFEAPFWVGVFERSDEEKGYRVARVVFGAEPTDAQVYEFVLRQRHSLAFSQPGSQPAQPEREIKFKRRQRQARRATAFSGVTKKAYEALRLEREQQAEVRHEISKDERQAEEERKFRLRQARKKEKHRGH